MPKLKCPPADVAVSKKLRAAAALHAKWNQNGLRQFLVTPSNIPVPTSLEKAKKAQTFEDCAFTDPGRRGSDSPEVFRRVH